jgi:formylglycine-generating enzyme required for sulfatase activity
MVMVRVPAGEYQIGSTDTQVDAALELCNWLGGNCDRGWLANEQPVHAVELGGFWFDRTEVTYAQFATFVNDWGNQVEQAVAWLDVDDEDCRMEVRNGQFQPEGGYADHPVLEVSWYGARAYCEWAGGRLPTETEWEVAARGPERPLFPWGDEYDATCLNQCDASCILEWGDASVDDGYARTSPVGSFAAGESWSGAWDLAGNVWEWCSDWYGPYTPERQVNPGGPETGIFRVLRGGAWSNDPNYARSAFRDGGVPWRTYHNVGFRCVQDLEEG